jgi:threonine/homoserine/homoserine lactone efflux protein
MMQGLIAGWIFILSMAALFADENLRHAIPTALVAFLTVAVVSVPICVPIMLSYKHKMKKKQVVEIEVVE